jgi:outer membrane protein assembly factor BamB
MWRAPLAAGLISLLATAAASAAGNAWLQPGFSAAHSWANPHEKTLKPGNVARLQQLWSQKLGQFYVGATTQADGMVYACSNLYGLSALDAATGAEQWSTYTGGQCGSATLTAEAAYVTTWGGNPIRYALTAVRRADGGTLWSVPPAQSDSLGFENPTLAGNSLYVADRRSGVSAFDAGTGALRWKAETGMLNQQATVAGGLVYVSTWGNGSTAPHRVFAFSAKDGALKWSRPTDTANSQYPAAVAEGRVFVGSDTGALYAYDAAKGTPLWKASFSGYVSAPIVAAGPAVLVNTGSGTISALAAATGKVQWSTVLPGSATVASNLVLANGVIFFSTIDPDGQHKLATLDARTGRLIALLPALLWGSYSQVAVVDGRVQVATNYGILQVFGLN